MDKPQVSQEDISEMIEHRDMLLNLRSVLKTEAGKGVFKYLFKNLEVGQLPALGLEGPILMDKLGSLRAGRAIFEIVSEADALAAANLLAQIEKENYEKLYAQNSSGSNQP